MTRTGLLALIHGHLSHLWEQIQCALQIVDAGRVKGGQTHSP